MSAIYDSSGNLLLKSTGSALQVGDPSGLLTVHVTNLEVNGSGLVAEASLGPQFEWDTGLLVVDVSAPAGPSYSYVDGSLATRDADIVLKSDLTYVDASLDAKADITSVNDSLNTKLDASLISEGTPPNQSALGVQGQFQYDASYLYICTSTNTWMRISGEYTFGVI